MRPATGPIGPIEPDLTVPVGKTVEERVDEFLKDERASVLYSKEQVETLRLRTIDLCKKSQVAAGGGYSAVEDHLKFMRERIFPERRNVLRHYVNVRRQEAEIRAYELNPSGVDTLRLMSQVQRQIPFTESGVGWIGSLHGYGDNMGRYPSGAFGGTKAAIAAIEEQDEPVMHTTMPDKSYRNMVFDTRAKVADDLRVNDERLRAFLDEGGRAITPAEEIAVRKRNETWNRVSNIGEYLGDKLYKLSSWAGKGIISDSKAVEDSRYKAYNERQKSMLANMLWQLGPSPKDHAFYLKALQKVNEALEGSSDLMDQATFARLQGLFTEEIKREGTANEVELEEFNKRMQQLNADMLKGLEGHVAKEDEMWKFRLLQMFLILTPVGAFSLMGNVFSYIDPLAQLVGPLFDTNSLAHGIGSLASSDILGPFGEIGRAFGIDQATEFLLDNTPGVSQICDIFDFVTDNPITQQFFGVVSPLLSSPLLPLGIAGVYSIFRTANEIDHAIDVSKFREEQDKKLKSEFDVFEAKRDGTLKDRTSKFVATKHGELKKANLDVVTVRFISEMARQPDGEARLAAMFGGTKFKVKVIAADGSQSVESKELSELRKERGKLTDKDILAMIVDGSNAAASEACRKKMLLAMVKSDESVAKAISQMFGRADGQVELNIFTDIRFNVEVTAADGSKTVESKALAELKRDGLMLTPDAVLRVLNDPANAAIKQECIDRTLLFLSVKDDKKTAAQNVTEFRTKNVKKDISDTKLCDYQRLEIEREFIVKFAREQGMETHITDFKAAVANLEARMLEAETNRLYEMARSRIPDPSASARSPRASKLSGHSPLFADGTRPIGGGTAMAA